jgi:hypothetical protein
VLMQQAAAVYLGCVGLLVGGAGLAFDSLTGRGSKPSVPTENSALFVQANLASAPTPGDWPPQNAAVAYLEEWTTLVTPPARLPHQNPTAPQQSQGASLQQKNQPASRPLPQLDNPYTARASRDPQARRNTGQERGRNAARSGSPARPGAR